MEKRGEKNREEKRGLALDYPTLAPEKGRELNRRRREEERELGTGVPLFSSFLSSFFCYERRMEEKKERAKRGGRGRGEKACSLPPKISSFPPAIEKKKKRGKGGGLGERKGMKKKTSSSKSVKSPYANVGGEKGRESTQREKREEEEGRPG